MFIDTGIPGQRKSPQPNLYTQIQGSKIPAAATATSLATTRDVFPRFFLFEPGSGRRHSVSAVQPHVGWIVKWHCKLLLCCSRQWSPQRIFCLHLTLPSVSSAYTPTMSTSSFTTSTSLRSSSTFLARELHVESNIQYIPYIISKLLHVIIYNPGIFTKLSRHCAIRQSLILNAM